MSPASDHSSGRAERLSPSPASLPPSDNGSSPPPSSFGRERSRVTAAYVANLATRLSRRDQAILRDLARVRVLTGNQLERLHFYDLGLTNCDRARRRVLNRLIAWRVVTTLARRVGGVRAGSNGLVYSLDTAGQRVLRLLDDRDERPTRRPWTPGALFLAHTLAASELYVRLREAERGGRLELSTYRAEPASWQRTASLGTIKPDAYTLVAYGDVEDAWWIEVDQATESRNTIRRKLGLYLLAATAGVVGPHEVLPRVLVTVPDERRLTAIREIVADLGPVAERLISVTLHNEAVEYVAEVLHA
jgi:hypothetical protein